MQVVIVGAHGKVAMQLHPLLRRRGHRVRGLIRRAEQGEELRAAGAEPVLCDIETETDISEAVGSADAVVFLAGAGAGSGTERKWTVDRDGAIKLIDAAKENGIRRYVMVSAMGVDGPPRGGEVFQVYQKAKAQADQALRESGLGYTIIRPGRLTDDPARGRIALAPELPSGEIPRADVAAVLAHALETPAMAGRQFDLTSGGHSIDAAIEAALADTH